MNTHEMYDTLLTKAKVNLQAYGNKVVEYPSDKDGLYFSREGKIIRPLRHIYVWTPSFFMGMGALLYKDKQDVDALSFLEGFYEEYLEKVTLHKEDTMHDIGFTYSLYSVLLYKLTKEKKYAELSLLAADALLARFVSPYIRAWGRMDDSIPTYVEEAIKDDTFFTASHGLAIIDTMMNLPLLLFAYEYSKDKQYLNAALMHADSTSECFIRPDGSVMHAYDHILGKEENDCGYSVGSAWARGSAWAIYGYAVLYEYTGIKRYRNLSIAILEKYLESAECMPLWDLRLPSSEEQNIDTSAAVIIASAILTLKDETYFGYADRVLSEIQAYVNFDLEVPGMLCEQNGRGEYTIFGDYFLLELLSKQTHGYYKFW